MTFRGITNDNHYLQQSIILQFTNVIKSQCMSQFTYFFLLVVSINWFYSVYLTSKLPLVCAAK